MRKFGPYAVLGALIFFAEATYAVAHLATGSRYPGFVYDPHDITIDILLTLIWTGAGVAMLGRRLWMASLAFAGWAASVLHGVLYSVTIPLAGVPFLLAGVVTGVCIFKSFRPLVRTPGPPRAPDREPRPRERPPDTTRPHLR